MALLDILTPIVTLALVGHLVTRLKLLSDEDVNALARFSFGLLIPCLLFINTAEAEFGLGASLNLLLGYYGAVLVTYVVAIVLGKLAFNYDAKEQSIFAMGAAYPNTTIVGIPLVLQALGDQALTPLFLIIAIQNLVLFSIGTFFAERENLSFTNIVESLILLLQQLLRSPITLGLIAGLAVNLLSIPLPAALRSTFHLFSSAAVPTALFVLGASLTRYRIRDQWQPALSMTILKLLVMPLVAWILLFKILELPSLWAAAGLLAAAMPVGINAYAFGTRYQCALAQVAAGTLLSALLSLLSVGGILIYLGSLGL